MSWLGQKVDNKVSGNNFEYTFFGITFFRLILVHTFQENILRHIFGGFSMPNLIGKSFAIQFFCNMF